LSYIQSIIEYIIIIIVLFTKFENTSLMIIWQNLIISLLLFFWKFEITFYNCDVQIIIFNIVLLDNIILVFGYILYYKLFLLKKKKKIAYIL